MENEKKIVPEDNIAEQATPEHIDGTKDNISKPDEVATDVSEEGIKIIFEVEQEATDVVAEEVGDVEKAESEPIESAQDAIDLLDGIDLYNGDEPLESSAAQGEIEEVEFIPLDSLLYESEEGEESGYSSEPDGFESFFAEYRQLIAASLDAANKRKGDEVTEDNPAAEKAEEKAEIAEKPAKESKKKKQKSKEPDAAGSTIEWSGEITLEPEEYEALDEKDDIFVDELPPEVEEVDLIGVDSAAAVAEELGDADMQISFFSELQRADDSGDDDEVAPRKYDPKNPRLIDTIFEFLELFIFTLAAVMILTSFVFKHSVVEGDSMNTTLADGDHLIIWDAFYTPERGDIVVFEDYSTKLKKPVVKRVIGLPGDTVEIRSDEYGELDIYINGEYLDEEYAYYDGSYSFPGAGTWTIGEDELFVMGDNRYNSTDSRDSGVGPISIDSLLGKAVLRFYPLDKFGTFN